MSDLQTTPEGGDADSRPPTALGLEVVVVPVADVDRALAFYRELGRRLDADVTTDAEYTGTTALGPAVGLALPGALSAALSALTANLALELAPIRVDLIAAGFVDTPLSARLLGSDLDERRIQLSTALPPRRVVGPADVAALALHLMTNTELTGAVHDVGGGEQLVGV
ncbi:SDR family oxidoreductase [Pseudonocardia kujensis]|uniref:SDR family oxidoreductase n=1 Tax=Pseudonocardia kujensis TaxID=1128675 RepID=UPI001E55BCDA|nr:SDR family oxidoreductase [Pseudonocardia kujensis]MCE0766020.1 SDR family oxidoreductase [Pseudonocardia kujensis]